MDLRQIQYVVQVARAANFTRAAEQLHVAQPALSLAIRNLETEIGVRLFDRTSRRVSVTDAGTAFIPRAQAILDQTENLQEEMSLYSGGVRGRVRIAIWYHLDPTLPEDLKEFMGMNPQVHISISEIPAPEMLDGLRWGGLDIAFPLMSPSLDLSDLQWAVIREEPSALAVALDSPWAKKTSVAMQDLTDIQLIAPRPETSTRNWLDVALSVCNSRPQIVVETNEISAAVAYAAIGIGGVILPPRVIQAVEKPVAIVPISDGPKFVSLVVWSQRRYRGPAASRALEFMVSRLPEPRPEI